MEHVGVPCDDGMLMCTRPIPVQPSQQVSSTQDVKLWVQVLGVSKENKVPLDSHSFKGVNMVMSCHHYMLQARLVSPLLGSMMQNRVGKQRETERKRKKEKCETREESKRLEKMQFFVFKSEMFDPLFIGVQKP